MFDLVLLVALASVPGVTAPPWSPARDDPTREVRELRFLQSVSIDLLGRKPLAAEVTALRGKARSEVVADLMGRVEFWENWYENQLFYYLLIDNFRPASETIQQLPELLHSGRIDVLRALRAILISASFNARNPGPDTFVSTVLEQNLGITVQDKPRLLEAGKKMYDGYRSRLFRKQGESQADVVSIVVEQDDFARYFLARSHREVFGEEPTKEVLASWADSLRQNPAFYTELVRSWMLSDAYDHLLDRRRTKPDRAFIRSLYVDLLGRVPTYEEFQRIRNALQSFADPAPLRSVVARMMLDSGKVDWGTEHQTSAAFVNAAFRTFYGRQASQVEEEAFRAAFEVPEGGRSIVLKALLTHPEYQTY
ncbi:MAG: hypothetical protein H6834_18605 [Planctomycetes bacterium]|nr:hypothetical protein [Planctomycetota bacterium]